MTPSAAQTGPRSGNGGERPELITLRQLAELLAVRDRRTAQRVLIAAGYPIIALGRSRRVRLADAKELVRRSQVFYEDRELQSSGNGSELEGTLPEASQNARRGPISGARLPHEDGTESTPQREPRRGTAEMSANRRGWRERVEKNLYKNHHVSCRASTTHRSTTTCACPWQTHVPTGVPGKTRLTSFTAATRTEAKRERRKLLAAGPPSAPERKGDIRLDRYAEEVYFPTLKATAAVNTYVNRCRYYRRDIAPRLGHLRLKDITHEDVDRYLAGLAEDARARFVRTGRRNDKYIIEGHRALSAILTAAVKGRRITQNPCRGAVVPPYPVASSSDEGDEATCEVEKVLTPDQLVRLLEAARTTSRKPLRDEILCLLGSELGLRNSEVRALRPSHFDLDAHRARIVCQIIVVPREMREDGEKTWRETQPKSKRARTVILTPRLVSLLRRYIAELTADGSRPNGYLFPGSTRDAPIAIQTLTEVVARLQVRAGLINSAGRPLITYHGLRHTCASILICSGVPIFKVSQFLGHASVTVTEKVYAHLLSVDELDEVAGIFAQQPWSRAGERAGDD